MDINGMPVKRSHHPSETEGRPLSELLDELGLNREQLQRALSAGLLPQQVYLLLIKLTSSLEGHTRSERRRMAEAELIALAERAAQAKNRGRERVGEGLPIGANRSRRPTTRRSMRPRTRDDLAESLVYDGEFASVVVVRDETTADLFEIQTGRGLDSRARKARVISASRSFYLSIHPIPRARVRIFDGRVQIATKKSSRGRDLGKLLDRWFLPPLSRLQSPSRNTTKTGEQPSRSDRQAQPRFRPEPRPTFVSPVLAGARIFATRSALFVFVKKDGATDLFTLPVKDCPSRADAGEWVKSVSSDFYLRLTPRRVVMAREEEGELLVGVRRSRGDIAVLEWQNLGKILFQWAEPGGLELPAGPRQQAPSEFERLDWRVLPPGWWKRNLQSGRRTLGHKYSHKMALERIEFLDSLSPSRWYAGSHLGSIVYYVALFDRVAVADCVDAGNALYYVVRHDELDWMHVFRLTKNQARQSGAARVIHRGDWRARVMKIVGRSGTDP